MTAILDPVPTILIDQLLENPVIVTQSVTPDGQVERGSRVEVTSGQTAQASVTQTGIPLLIQEVFKVETQFAHGLGDHVFHVQVEDGVVQSSSLSSSMDSQSPIDTCHCHMETSRLTIRYSREK